MDPGGSTVPRSRNSDLRNIYGFATLPEIPGSDFLFLLGYFQQKKFRSFFPTNFYKQQCKIFNFKLVGFQGQIQTATDPNVTMFDIILSWEPSWPSWIRIRQQNRIRTGYGTLVL
jgi:hypothetical protein